MRKFINKYSLLSLFFCVLEQLIVASSTLWIVRLGQSVVSNDMPYIWLILFVMSLTLVFIPRLFANANISHAKYITFRNFINDYKNNLFNQPHLLTNEKFNHQYQSYFINQTWIVVNDAFDFFLDLFTTLFNVVFNIIVVCYTVNFKLFYGYLIAFFIIIFNIFILKNKINKINIHSQKSHAEMNDTLVSGWDTILVGNVYNILKWSDNFLNKSRKSEKYNVKLSVFSDLTSMFSMLLSLIPIMTTSALIFLSNKNTLILSALVVTLPRQVNTIQYISILISSAVKVTGIKAKIADIEKSSILPLNYESYIGTISWGEIYAYTPNGSTQINSIEDIYKITNNFHPCRVTIRGNNGTGKFTILMNIKQQLADKAYYLPSNSNIFFASTFENEHSTGEKIIAQLIDIIDNADIEVILLDEWDANLDQTNIDRISKLIDKLSGNKCIIEVRHRP